MRLFGQIQEKLGITLIILFALYFPRTIHAEYVLPYPSFMPGNHLYRLSHIMDAIERWWYWGNIASVKYHLKLADKYLVEAKTLFEYHQYQLGVEALKRSDVEVLQLVNYLALAQHEGKDVQKLKAIVVSAMNVHIATLEKLSKELPETYQWTPEKQSSTTINFSLLVSNAISERMNLVK